MQPREAAVVWELLVKRDAPPIPGKVLKWVLPSPTEANLRVVISSIRAGIEKEPGNPRYLRTVLGSGYRLENVNFKEDLDRFV